MKLKIFLVGVNKNNNNKKHKKTKTILNLENNA